MHPRLHRHAGHSGSLRRHAITVVAAAGVLAALLAAAGIATVVWFITHSD